MSDDYGLIVKNNSGGTMFDSRRGLNSYVIREMGTGSSVSDTTNIADELIFVRPPAGQEAALSGKILYASPRINGIACGFYQFDRSAMTYNTVTLDYFVVTHSKNAIGNDDYGLQIRNDDNSIQFDSRSVKFGNHFLITTYHPPNTVPGDGGEQYFLGDVNDYWEIGKWTMGLMGASGAGQPVQDYALQGIQFFGDEPRAWGIYDYDLDPEPNDETGGFNPPSQTIIYRKIRQMILSAELV